ncbi:MAG TPA: PQQ-dependent sugar dehydrogenase [Trueperaceae bacterium]
MSTMEQPRHSLAFGFLLSLVLLLAACSGMASAQDIGLDEVASGLERPISMTHAGDGTGRLFVVEQTGRIRVIQDGRLLREPFLDLRSIVSCCGEQGLLGLAFHPDYEQNGRFFVDYTDATGNTVVAEYHVSEDADRAAPDSGRGLLQVEQPYDNHNGGQLAFGPDGYLYISLGDGGSGGDPHGNGQNLGTLLGKILRIDVDEGDPYAIPDDNPFAHQSGARPEIWAYGLRNPWRFSFDRQTGDLWIADVGQSQWEEVNLQPAGSQGGENYGWNVMEGAHCYQPDEGCDESGKVLPLLEYSHDEGCSITGGYRYRGETQPGLRGVYLFSDYCSGTIWGARQDEKGAWRSEVLLEPGFGITTFGEDEAGELYVADYGDGTIYRVVAPH